MTGLRFTRGLALRIALLAAALVAATWLLVAPGYHAGTLIAAALVGILTANLWYFVSRTNRETARFLDAAKHADFSQRFDFGEAGAGFPELGEAFRGILERMRLRATDQASELRRLAALVEHIPVPLITLHDDHRVTLQNNAARRLFGAAPVTRLGDLLAFGARFHEAVLEAVPGRRELVNFSVDGVEYHLTLATTELTVEGRRERLISLQDIQSELDATEAEAWQDLVTVLTHEIMNSITPVTSLAATAADLTDTVRARVTKDPALAEDLDDLHDAVATVARRADSLNQFVESYRQITRLVPPEKKRVPVGGLLESAAKLARAEWGETGARLAVEIDPPGLDVHADPDLLEPVLLNLLRNAWQATRDLDAPRLALAARLNRRGRVVIEVTDNGPGVPEDLRTRVFVPFFTTKPGGSGVGLALARQVMIAHGGFVRVDEADGGGARFTLIF